jgi:hypothetical protein
MITAAIVKLASVTESIVTDKFKELIIARWTRYRAKAFFEGFVECLRTEQAVGHEISDVDNRLTAILADEAKSELLFDAYRRVCFTKSKTLGPRIIGLLTGELVLQGRMATHAEECIFEAAESLSDGEFVDFLKEYQEYRGKAIGKPDEKAEVRLLGQSIIILWYQEKITEGTEAEIGPFPWGEAFGPWAIKLNRCGLITDRTRQKTNPTRQNSGPFDGQERMSVETDVTFEPECAELSRLVLRSLGSERNE